MGLGMGLGMCLNIWYRYGYVCLYESFGVYGVVEME